VKCLADGVRLEDCSTRLVRKRQNCGLRIRTWNSALAGLSRAQVTPTAV